MPARWRKAGADAIWPSEAKAKAGADIVVVREDAEKGEFIYRSDHFQFTSDIRMSKSVVEEFSQLFEATHAALRALPLGHRLPEREAPARLGLRRQQPGL